MRNTLIVNLYGAPSSGKSTMASKLFYELKVRGVSCELVTEYAKDLVWEARGETFKNEVYIFAKQHHRLFRVSGKVDVIITDRPLLLTKYYNSKYGNGRFIALDNLVLEQYYSMNNFDIFLNRTHKFSPEGRNENEAQANQIEVEMRNMLENYSDNLVKMDSTNVDNIIQTIEIESRIDNE